MMQQTSNQRCRIGMAMAAMIARVFLDGCLAVDPRSKTAGTITPDP